MYDVKIIQYIGLARAKSEALVYMLMVRPPLLLRLLLQRNIVKTDYFVFRADLLRL